MIIEGEVIYEHNGEQKVRVVVAQISKKDFCDGFNATLIVQKLVRVTNPFPMDTWVFESLMCPIRDDWDAESLSGLGDSLVQDWLVIQNSLAENS